MSDREILAVPVVEGGLEGEAGIERDGVSDREILPVPEVVGAAPEVEGVAEVVGAAPEIEGVAEVVGAAPEMEGVAEAGACPEGVSTAEGVEAAAGPLGSMTLSTNSVG